MNFPEHVARREEMKQTALVSINVERKRSLRKYIRSFEYNIKMDIIEMRCEDME
jgi:hypothetical protein